MRSYLGRSFCSCGKSKQFICCILEHSILLLEGLEQIAHYLWFLSLGKLLIIKLRLLLGEILLVFSLRLFPRDCSVTRFLGVRLFVLYTARILFGSVGLNLSLIVFAVLLSGISCTIKFILWLSSGIITWALNGLLHRMIQIQATHIDGLLLGTLRDWGWCRFLSLLRLYGCMISLTSLALKGILIIKTELRISWFWALLRSLISNSGGLWAYFGSGLLHQSQITYLFL